jgi:F-type H+-transporting ATPase subunit delta
MSEITVATRYAKSLIELAKDENALDKVNKDMEFFLQTLKANPQLTAVLANPIIYHDKKINIIDGIFGGKVSKLSISFFNIMINKGRAEILYTAAQEYINQYDVLNNITKATIVTASPLSEVNKKAVIADIEKSTKGPVKLTVKVDPALIGGFIVTIGDMQIDTSIAGNLAKLKKDFAQGVAK